MSWMYSIELPQGALIKRQMQLTMDAVTFNGKSIPVAAIDVVKSQVTRQFVNGIPTATTYKVQLEGQGGLRQTMKWSFASLQKQETKDKCEQAYRTMIDLIRDQAGPRIVANQLAKPLPTKFGPYEITPEGVGVSGLLSAKQAPWVAITGATMNQGVYSVTFVDEQGRGKAFGAMSLWDANAIFLPEVMTGYRNWFLQPR